MHRSIPVREVGIVGSRGRAAVRLYKCYPNIKKLAEQCQKAKDEVKTFSPERHRFSLVTLCVIIWAMKGDNRERTR